MNKQIIAFIIGVLITVPTVSYGALSIAERLNGKILLAVEDSGKTYYVSGSKRYRIDANTAQQVFKKLAIGISNVDLAKIEEAQLDGIDNKYQEYDVKYYKDEAKDDVKKVVINDMFDNVVSVTCFDANMSIISSGSGSLWNFHRSSNIVLTNRHVIVGNYCFINGNDISFIKLDTVIMDWNNETDVAALKIIDGDNLDYSLSNTKRCATKLPLASKVYVIGFPSYSKGKNGFNSLTVTTGIISSYKNNNDKIPYSDYYIDAKIDSGNSGGLAFAEIDGELCTLGIPTAVSIGNYENQGIVQNINNVFWVNK